MIRILLLAAVALAAAAFAWVVYARRELPVRGRTALGVLRFLAVFGTLALLADPWWPRAGDPSGPPLWVLLDVSRSMGVGADGAPTPWEEALARADELAGDGARVLRFGERVADGIARAPLERRSSLAPALARALEAGARRIVVLSDMRVDDPLEVEGIVRRFRPDVSFERVGGPVANAGVAALRVPDASAPDRGVEAEVEIFADDGADSVRVDVREEERLVASRTVPAPREGLTRQVVIPLPPASREGLVRYAAVAVRPGDRHPADDTAVAYALAGAAGGGVVVLAVRPDWETRTLSAVLGESSGLPLHVFVRVAGGRWTVGGRAIRRGPPVDSAFVRRAAQDAAMLVVLGLGGDAPPWLRRVVSRAPHVLAWPDDPAGARLLDLAVGGRVGGEWYVAGRLPPSPMASELVGVSLAGLPPLANLLTVTEEGWRPVVDVQLGGSGAPEPALLVRTSPGRRVAASVARGTWRWAVRPGEPRDAYRRLWAGVTGWLLRDGEGGATAPAPLQHVVEEGSPLRWRVPEGMEPVRLRLAGGAGDLLDTTLAVAGVSSTPAPPPGSYTYSLAPREGEARTGRLDVTARTLELARAPAVIDVPPAAPTAAVGTRGRPLRTSVWPYLLILLALTAEWIGRRRVGLR